MRRFHLQRDKDDSGVSGTGRVAEGVLLNNGWVITEWNSHHKEIITSESIAVFEKLHGHDGKAHIIWHDPDPYEEKKNGHTADTQPTVEGTDPKGCDAGATEERRSSKVRAQTEEDRTQTEAEGESQEEDETQEV